MRRFVDTLPYKDKKTELTNSEVSSIPANGAGSNTIAERVLERDKADKEKDQLAQKLEHLARAVNDASSTIKLSYSVERTEPDVKGKIGVFIEFSTKEGHDKFLKDIREASGLVNIPVLETVKSVSAPDKVKINGRKAAAVSFSLDRGNKFISDDDNVQVIARLMQKSLGEKSSLLIDEFSHGDFSKVAGKTKIPLDNKVLGITTLAL